MEQVGIAVELGQDEGGNATHTYQVVPQRQARVLRKLFDKGGVFSDPAELTDALQSDVSFDGLYETVGGKLYEVLRVFIPDLMPRWEFDGYASEAAAAEGRYDEQADRSPTHPQVIEALRVSIEINGARWIRKLGKVLNPDLLRAQLNAELASRVSASRNQDGSSASLPPQNGESTPTSSGMSAPTPQSPSPPTAPDSPFSPSGD